MDLNRLIPRSRTLVDGSPQAMLLAIDLHKDFVNVKSVAVSTTLPLKSPSTQSAELDAPQADRFPSDDDAAFGQEIFDIAVAEIEAIVKPDCVGNVRRKTLAFIGIHPTIPAISGS